MTYRFGEKIFHENPVGVMYGDFEFLKDILCKWDPDTPESQNERCIGYDNDVGEHFIYLIGESPIRGAWHAWMIMHGAAEELREMCTIYV